MQTSTVVKRTLRTLITDNKGQTNYRCFYNGKIRKNNMNQHIVIYGELEMNIPCQIIPLIYNTIL